MILTSCIEPIPEKQKNTTTIFLHYHLEIFTMLTAEGNLFDILLNNDIDFKSQISTGPSLIPITKYCLKL